MLDFGAQDKKKLSGILTTHLPHNSGALPRGIWARGAPRTSVRCPEYVTCSLTVRHASNAAKVDGW